MSEETLDVALEQWFQSAFAMTREEEDAFWRRFTGRRGEETEVWRTFTTVMLGLNQSLRRSTAWAAWPAHGIPGVGRGDRQ